MRREGRLTNYETSMGRKLHRVTITQTQSLRQFDLPAVGWGTEEQLKGSGYFSPAAVPRPSSGIRCGSIALSRTPTEMALFPRLLLHHRRQGNGRHCGSSSGKVIPRWRRIRRSTMSARRAPVSWRHPLRVRLLATRRTSADRFMGAWFFRMGIASEGQLVLPAFLIKPERNDAKTAPIKTRRHVQVSWFNQLPNSEETRKWYNHANFNNFMRTFVFLLLI